MSFDNFLLLYYFSRFRPAANAPAEITRISRYSIGFLESPVSGTSGLFSLFFRLISHCHFQNRILLCNIDTVRLSVFLIALRRFDFPIIIFTQSQILHLYNSVFAGFSEVNPVVIPIQEFQIPLEKHIPVSSRTFRICRGSFLFFRGTCGFSGFSGCSGSEASAASEYPAHQAESVLPALQAVCHFSPADRDVQNLGARIISGISFCSCVLRVICFGSVSCPFTESMLSVSIGPSFTPAALK